MKAEEIYRAALERIAEEDCGFPSHTPQAMVSIAKRAMKDAADSISALRECPNSPFGRCQVDTSMESGPNNCFHCERSMK